MNLNQPRNFRRVIRPQMIKKKKKKNVTEGIWSLLRECGTPALFSHFDHQASFFSLSLSRNWGLLLLNVDRRLSYDSSSFDRLGKEC